jgi:hypothetical protein
MFTATYTAVNESTARLSKEMSSFSDYVPGAATRSQHYYTDKIVEYANDLLAKYSTEDNEKTEKVQYYIDKYSAKVAETIDKQHAIDCRCPSVMISGGSNFPVAKKNKQIAAWDALNKETAELWYTDDRNYYYKKIRLLLTDSGAIRSDDKNAVDKIKAKIAKLEAAEPDRWGYNKTEIRRLKERLLQLAPEEFAEQQANITVNGAKTYEEIVALWETGRKHKSVYDPESPHWYYDLVVDFTDGKRHYKGMVSIEVDEAGENMQHWNNEKRESEFIPLTDERKYKLIIGQVAGSGNKAVIYKHLESLIPKAQAKTAEVEPESDTAETVTINGETAKIIRNKEEMRLQLVFDGKPAEKTREILKSNGFRWAPSQSAWQRLLNDNSEYALKRIAA